MRRRCPLAAWAWPLACALLLLRLPADEAVAQGRPPTRAGAARAARPQRRRATRLPATGEQLGADVAARTSRGAGFGEQSVVDALAAMRRGEMVIVTDDETRENEGDLIIAAEHASAESIAFMVRHTSGVLCVGMDSERIDALQLPQMVSTNEDPKMTAFTVSVDARTGTTTGISAADRAETLRQLARASSTADDFQRPGHIFPLRARKHGVLARQGHTEAAVDLCRLAGLAPAGVLCEIVSADGQSMARMPELLAFGKEHNLVVTTITDLVRPAHAFGAGASRAAPRLAARSLPLPPLSGAAAGCWGAGGVSVTARHNH